MSRDAIQGDGIKKANRQIESEVVNLWMEATTGVSSRTPKRRTTRWPAANDIVTSETTAAMRALETSACLEEWQGGPGAPCLAAADQDPHSGGIFTRTRSHSHHAMSDGGTASQSARDYAGGGCDAAVERAVGKPREDGVFARTRSHTETFDAMQIESLDEAVPQCEREKNGSQLSSVPRGGPLQASGEEIFRELVALGEHRQVSCEELDFALGEGPESTVVIGAGSGGVVYKAEYRGQNVAVKVALVPPEKDVGSGQGTQAQARSERGKGSSASCRHLPAPADKMLSASPIDAERQVKDMVQEIQAGLRLPPHPNLALFVGASLSPPNLFVVFELIDGLDIEALYRQKRSASGEAWRPPVAQVLRWGRQIYGVLDFLHTLTPPLIHRDVKPANVMLTSDLQTVKLVDFGLATGLSKKRARQGALVVSAALPFANSLPASGSSQAAGEDDSTQQRMTGKTGSFRYMAPEVMLEHEQYGAKVDVYSATMLLWYLLMGEPPFNGIEGDVVALMAAREGLRPNLREIKDDRLKAIMERGWHSDSETRASAAEMAESIRQLGDKLEASRQAGSATATASARASKALSKLKKPVSSALSAFSRVLRSRAAPSRSTQGNTGSSRGPPLAPSGRLPNGLSDEN